MLMLPPVSAFCERPVWLTRAKCTVLAFALCSATWLSTTASVQADEADNVVQTPAAGQPPAEAAESQVSRAAITHSGQERLEAELARVHARRAHKTNLWPWLLTGTGAGYVLLGTMVNAAIALDCDAHCPAPAWSTLLVLVGAALGTAGAVWLVRTDHTIAQLESEAHQLERELDRYRARGPERAVLASGGRPAFSLRLAF